MYARIGRGFGEERKKWQNFKPVKPGFSAAKNPGFSGLIIDGFPGFSGPRGWIPYWSRLGAKIKRLGLG